MASTLGRAVLYAGVALLLSLTACGGKTDKCKGVSCPTGQTCNADTGTCGGGAGTDGGTDGGTGACTPACTSDKPVCNEANHTCVVCTAASGCSGQTPICDTQAASGAGACVQCLATQDCTTGTCDPTSHTCVVVQGDTCASAVTVDVSSGSATVHADTTGSHDDATGSCSVTGNNELVYKFTLSAAKDITVHATVPSGSNADPVLYLRKGTCTSSGAEIDCQDTGIEETLTELNQTAGDYYLFVENGGEAGKIDVAIALSGPTPPPDNDTCTAPAEIAFTAGSASFAADTTTATDNLSGSCSSSSGKSKDLVYHFTLTAPQDVTFTATPAGNTVDPVIYLRGAPCDSGTELDCEDTGFGGEAETLTGVNLQPNTDYYLVIETYPGSEGLVNVTGTLAPPTIPPANDTCTTPETITTFPATVTGSDKAAANDYQAPCTSADGADVVYSLAIPQAGTVTITATPDNDQFLNLTVRDANSCASTGSTGAVACMTAAGVGKPVTVSFDATAAATYFLIVDSGDSTLSGGFTLNISETTTATPANEACGTASAITLTTSGNVSTGTATGTTKGATSDTTNAACGSTASSGPDVFYSFTTPSGGPYTAKVLLQTENALAYLPLLDVRTSALCSSTTATDQLICDTATGVPFIAQGMKANLAGSTTFDVIADSADSTAPAGPFKLEVEVGTAPANDTCAGAIALTANTTVSGNTLAATGDYDSSVNNWYTGASACGDTFKGPDVVYSYQATADGTVNVTVTPEGGYDVGVGVLSSCAENACLITKDIGYDGDPERVSFQATSGHTYFILIDSFYDVESLGVGAFGISVTQ